MIYYYTYIILYYISRYNLDINAGLKLVYLQISITLISLNKNIRTALNKKDLTQLGLNPNLPQTGRLL